MWAYADTDVVVEFNGKEYRLLTKDQHYESEDARKYCLKYWNWHRKKFGVETTEKEVREKFQFRCFQCQNHVSAAIIPKSDIDTNGKKITYKRTPYYKCIENNCYGGGRAAPALEEFNVITDKAVIPVTELRPPPQHTETFPSVKIKTDGLGQTTKKNRTEIKTSTSIAPICEQFYNYYINGTLTEKFISVPFISKDMKLSYSYLFIDMSLPEKNKTQKIGIYYGSPHFWVACSDGYLVVFKNTDVHKTLLIKMKKSPSSLNAIVGAAEGRLLFVLGHLSRIDGIPVVTSDSDFWCHSMALPKTDTCFLPNKLVEKSDVVKSEHLTADVVIQRLIEALKKPPGQPEKQSAMAKDIDENADSRVPKNIAEIAKRSLQNIERNQNEKKVSESINKGIRADASPPTKKKQLLEKAAEILKRWFGL
jgi:hypothetical protein